MRDATLTFAVVVVAVNFNPRVPCGTRPGYNLCRQRYSLHFNPRVPCGTRRPQIPGADAIEKNFNPRVPCGTRRALCYKGVSMERISIHASHAGRDWNYYNFSIEISTFQSTRPMRDATATSTVAYVTSHFNPRVPCGTRLLCAYRVQY